MACMARTFGAPLSVPAGKVGSHRVEGVEARGQRSAVLRPRCMTWVYRSTSRSEVTSSLAGAATRPTSFRARITSITCSARSFGSARSFSLERRVVGRVLGSRPGRRRSAA